MTEAYQYQMPRELVTSNGFSVEYDKRVTDQELKDDIISYLGEYRFELQKYDYELVFSQTSDEGWRLRDPHRLEAMGVKAQRSVRERVMRGESTNRESAEAVGISFLEKQLQTSDHGDSIVWASPPGSKEDGYGDYGFFFLGKIRRSIEARKEISMTAIRVENPSIDGFKKAFSTITNTDIDLKNAEDFLRNPKVVSGGIDPREVDLVLSKHFNPFADSASEKESFRVAMQRLEPRIDELILMVRWGTKEEKKKAFHALENYALVIKKELESGRISVYEAETKFDDFVKAYGFEPPEVRGSCPIKSNNPLVQGFESLNKALGLDEDEKFRCPSCKKEADGPVGNKCPNCGITKEEYAKKAQGPVC